MRVITILIGNVYTFPPVLSLLNTFEEMNIDSILITTKSKENLRKDYLKTTIEEIELEYEKIKNPIKKLLILPFLSKKLWFLINKYYNEDSILWVVTDVTIKYLGNKLISKNYILHLMELSEDLYYYHKIPFFKMDKEKIGNNALAIIVPEYNRAHIIKALWNLKNIPLVLPNKPCILNQIKKNSFIEDKEAKKIIDKIGNKKIILYQGIISKERPLEMFIQAVDKYEGEYAFVIMSGGKNIYENIESKNFYFIPFVAPPKHLQITSHAHIGILSYTPTNGTGYSPLNSLYCAPNKTFEYSMFGIPMLGNNIPGLKYLFGTQNNGICFENFSIKDICEAIDKIESNYTKYSINSLKYFNTCDYKKIVFNILRNVKEIKDYKNKIGE